MNHEGDGLGQLGHFLLEPEHRGAGTGRRLVQELLSFARSRGPGAQR